MREKKNDERIKQIRAELEKALKGQESSLEEILGEICDEYSQFCDESSEGERDKKADASFRKLFDQIRKLTAKTESMSDSLYLNYTTVKRAYEKVKQMAPLVYYNSEENEKRLAEVKGEVDEEIKLYRGAVETLKSFSQKIETIDENSEEQEQ